MSHFHKNACPILNTQILIRHKAATQTRDENMEHIEPEAKNYDWYYNDAAGSFGLGI